jgi:hypothetical protein
MQSIAVREYHAGAVGGSLAGSVALILGGLTVAFLLTGFPFRADYTRGMELGVFPDVLHERATAEEALSGDPYRPISEIMAEEGLPEMEGGRSPRTPAALLFQLPLTAIPDGSLMPAVTGLILLLVAVAFWLTHRISGVGWRWMAWSGALAFFSHPVVTAISYGSISVVLMTVLVLSAWAFQDEVWSGIPLGIAGAMRLWPALIMVGFWVAGRRKAAYVAGAVFVLTNAVALVLPGITMEGSIGAILTGAADWMTHSQNASIAALVGGWGVPAIAPIIAICGLTVWLAWRRPSEATPLCVLGGLMASPLSWPAYLIVTLPILASWWKAGGRLPVSLIAAGFLLWPFTPTAAKGLLGSLALVVMFVHLVVSGHARGASAQPATIQ